MDPVFLTGSVQGVTARAVFSEDKKMLMGDAFREIRNFTLNQKIKLKVVDETI